MACNYKTVSLPCVGKVIPIEPLTQNINLNYRSTKSYIKTLSSSVSVEKNPIAGKFGNFGGKFVAEVLMSPLAELEAEFNSVLVDDEFRMEVATALRDYVGRETPLYYAQKLSDHYKNMNGEGPDIYIKREDLSHGGSYKMNNVIAQAILAKRMGRKSVITATSAGHHGVAVAAVCAKFSLDCTVVIGTKDMQRKPSNVQLMELFGAQLNKSSDPTTHVLRPQTATNPRKHLKPCVGECRIEESSHHISRRKLTPRKNPLAHSEHFLL